MTDEIEKLHDEKAEVITAAVNLSLALAEAREALKWYRDTVGCVRMNHSEGDAARLSLHNDCGSRAQKALAAPAPSCALGEVERLVAEARADMDKRGVVNAILAGLLHELQPQCPDMVERIKRGNDAANAILAALSPQRLDAKGGVTLYREVDALGGTGFPDEGESWSRGYSEALSDVLDVLTKRGFTEAADATPSQRLDAATVERRRKALREALEHVDSIAGEMNGVAERAHLIDADDAAMNLADAYGVEFAPGWEDEVAALATEPHQHGGKGA